MQRYQAFRAPYTRVIASKAELLYKDVGSSHTSGGHRVDKSAALV